MNDPWWLTRTQGKQLLVFWVKLILVLGLSCGIVATQACRKSPPISNVPSGVSTKEVNAWYSATGTVLFASEVTREATNTVIRLNRAGVFPDGTEYRATLVGLRAAASAELEAVRYLRTVPQQFGKPVQDRTTEYLREMETSLQNALSQGLLGIKNEDRKNEYKALLEQSLGAVLAVKSLLDSFRSDNRIPQMEVSFAVAY